MRCPFESGRRHRRKAPAATGRSRGRVPRPPRPAGRRARRALPRAYGVRRVRGTPPTPQSPRHRRRSGARTLGARGWHTARGARALHDRRSRHVWPTARLRTHARHHISGAIAKLAPTPKALASRPRASIRYSVVAGTPVADGGAELLQRGERPGDGNCWVLHTWLHGCPPMVVSRFALRTNGTGRRGQLGGQPVGLYSRAIVFALRRKTRRLGDRAGETGATPGGGGTGGLDGQLADCPLAGSRESCPVGLCSFVVRARIHPTGGQDEVRAVDLRQARLTRGAV